MEDTKNEPKETSDERKYRIRVEFEAIGQKVKGGFAFDKETLPKLSQYWYESDKPYKPYLEEAICTIVSEVFERGGIVCWRHPERTYETITGIVCIHDKDSEDVIKDGHLNLLCNVNFHLCRVEHCTNIGEEDGY